MAINPVSTQSYNPAYSVEPPADSSVDPGQGLRGEVELLYGIQPPTDPIDPPVDGRGQPPGDGEVVLLYGIM